MPVAGEIGSIVRGENELEEPIEIVTVTVVGKMQSSDTLPLPVVALVAAGL